MHKAMAKAAAPMVKVTIRPGPASPAQKTAWRKFWQKLIAEVKNEADK